MFRTLLLFFFFLACLSAAATAQVNGPGPSDPNDFDVVINLPIDQVSIGGNIGNSNGAPTPTTQINVTDGGSVGYISQALSGIELNISGGSVGQSFWPRAGSEVNLSGGSVGFNFRNYPGSDVQLIGGEFELNGAAFTDTTITLVTGDVFTGTLADGSSFIFSNIVDALDGVRLTAASLPALNTTPQVINTDISDGPSGLRAGQELTLQAGGVIGNAFAVVDATLNIQGGSVGSGLETSNSVVNISGGSVGASVDHSLGNSLRAYSGSVVNISGDSVVSGFSARTGSVVNMNGGSVGDFGATTGGVVNISGGSVGLSSGAGSGSEVNISGGSLAGVFRAHSGSVVNISGGNVGRHFEAFSGSDVQLIGGEFELNGASYTDATITLTTGDVFTGTLSDGSSFIFKRLGNLTDQDSLDGVRLTAASLPVLNTSPQIISTDISDGPSGLRAGQELTLQAGGVLGNNFAVVDATLNIQGGSVGSGLETTNGVVNLSGGSVGRSFEALSGSNVQLIGGEFELNGAAYTGATITLTTFDVFTGTLADGSSFLFCYQSGDRLEGVTLTAGPLPTLNTTPRIVSTDISGEPSGLREGQELTLQAGGVLGSAFAVVDATLNIQGGVVGNGLESSNSKVNISGGSLGDRFSATPGSVVNISGGSLGDGFAAHSDSVVNISGGSVGGFLTAYTGSEVNISGGTVGELSRAHSGSVVNISGGKVGRVFKANMHSVVNISGGSVSDNFATSSVVNISGGSVGDRFNAYLNSVVNISGGSLGTFIASSGSEVNLFGTEFFLDGDLLDTLVQDEPMTITDRGGQILSGTLADGSAFSFDLNDSFALGEDYFDFGALLTVTLATPLLGDFDLDDDVDGSDFLLLQRNPGIGNLADWEANFGKVSVSSNIEANSLPEPNTAILVIFLFFTIAGSPLRLSD